MYKQDKIKFLFLTLSIVIALCGELYTQQPLLQQSQQQILLSGKNAFDNARYDEAVSIFLSCLRSDPGNLRAHEYLINSYVAQKKYKDAIKAIETALKYSPGKAELLLIEGKLYGITGNYNKAVQVFETYLGKNPDDAEAKDLLGKLHQNLAIQSYNDKKYEQAVSYFTKALIYDPRNPELYNNIIAVLLQLKKNKEALSKAEQAVRLFPRSDKFRNLYVDMLIQERSYKKAVEYMEDLCKEDPDSLSYSLKLGLAYRYNGQAEKAVKLYDSLMIKHPAERSIYKEAISYFDLDTKKDKVRELYNKMLIYFPGDPEVMKNIGLSYEAENKYDEARKYYTDWFNRDTSNSELLVKIARLYLKEKNDSLATGQLSRVFQFDKKNLTAYILIGELYIKHSRLKDALENYKEFYTNFPMHYIASYHLGKTFLSLGEKDSAAKYLELSKRLNSTYAFTFFSLGELAFEKKDTLSALSYYRKTIDRCLSRFVSLQNEISEQITDKNGNLKLDKLHNTDPLEKETQDIIRIFNSAFARLKDNLSEKDYLVFLDNSLREHNTNVLLLMKKAQYFESKGEYAQAIEYCRRTLSLNSIMKEALEQLARIYEKQKNIDQAILSWKRIIGIEPQNIEAYNNVIRISQEHNKLNPLCDEWLAKYNISKDEFLKEPLLEALHKAGRKEEALKIAKPLN